MVCLEIQILVDISIDLHFMAEEDPWYMLYGRNKALFVVVKKRVQNEDNFRSLVFMRTKYSIEALYASTEKCTLYTSLSCHF